jgi:pimeloyl-ACP methyl ester carboxylesterase
VYAIAGEYDPTARDAIHGAPAVAAKVPGVVFVEAKGLGHFAPSDDPLAFGALILPILDEVLSVTKRH